MTFWTTLPLFSRTNKAMIAEMQLTLTLALTNIRTPKERKLNQKKKLNVSKNNIESIETGTAGFPVPFTACTNYSYFTVLHLFCFESLKLGPMTFQACSSHGPTNRYFTAFIFLIWEMASTITKVIDRLWRKIAFAARYKFECSK